MPRSTPHTQITPLHPTALLEMYYLAPLVVSVMNAPHISNPQSVFLLFSTITPPHTHTHHLLSRRGPPLTFSKREGVGGCQASTKYAFRGKQRGVDEEAGRVGGSGGRGEL